MCLRGEEKPKLDTAVWRPFVPWLNPRGISFWGRKGSWLLYIAVDHRGKVGVFSTPFLLGNLQNSGHTPLK